MDMAILDSNRFFLWVWRLIGLGILLGGLMIVIGIIYSVISDMGRQSRVQQPAINVAEDPSGNENWALSRGVQLGGSDFVLFPLVSDKRDVNVNTGSFDSSYRNRKKMDKPAKNILFINAVENSSRWLFKDNERLIIQTTPFPSSYADYSIRDNPKVIFYTVVSSDTNDDGTLNYKDKRSLAISELDGSAYSVVLSEYDRVISKTMVDENRTLIVYQVGDTGYSKLFALSPFKNISTKELPKVVEPK